MNFKMTISYDGSRYLGWQKQKNTDNTIQGKIENVLEKLFDDSIEIVGSGRTDAGVHALGQVANFKVGEEYFKKNKFIARMLDAGVREDNILTLRGSGDSFDKPEEINNLAEMLLLYINHYLPDDIAVTMIDVVDERFHSRYLAKEKWYRYRIWNSNITDVFERKYVYQLNDKLNLDLMKEASRELIGEYDFAAFTTLKNTKKSTVRKIDAIDISERKVPGGREIILDFRGEGFLYNMVRIITGSLIEVGEGKRSIDSLLDAMDSGVRENAGYLVPGKGLCLMEVKY